MPSSPRASSSERSKGWSADGSLTHDDALAVVPLLMHDNAERILPAASAARRPPSD